MRPRNLEKEASIRTVALQLIAQDGLENLSMQKLAKAANVSPRTIYIKYENKEDFLVKLFIDDVLVAYEKAVLENFSPAMSFTEGMHLIWLNTFRYLTTNKPAFALIRHGKASPLLNRAFQERGIQEGYFFAPIDRFFQRHADAGTIRLFHQDIYRALFMSPVQELVNEYFDYQQRPEQIITEASLLAACDVVTRGIAA